MDKKTADRLAKQIVDKSPQLRKIKSVAQGEKHIGEINNVGNSEEYKANYDKIDWGKKDESYKPKYRVKINGVYQDEDDQV